MTQRLYTRYMAEQPRRSPLHYIAAIGVLCALWMWLNW
jgi:hypothetical protein